MDYPLAKQYSDSGSLQKIQVETFGRVHVRGHRPAHNIQLEKTKPGQMVLAARPRLQSQRSMKASSSRAVHEALSLDYLAHEGLASLLTIWRKLTAKDLNRPVRTRTPGGVGGAQPKG